MVESVSVTNHTVSPLVIPAVRSAGGAIVTDLKASRDWLIRPGETVVGVPRDHFEQLRKGNKALEAIVDTGRVTVHGKSEEHVEELRTDTHDAERPDDLKDTADKPLDIEFSSGHQKTIQNTVTAVEEMKIDDDAPKRGRGRPKGS